MVEAFRAALGLRPSVQKQACGYGIVSLLLFECREGGMGNHEYGVIWRTMDEYCSGSCQWALLWGGCTRVCACIGCCAHSRGCMVSWKEV